MNRRYKQVFVVLSLTLASVVPSGAATLCVNPGGTGGCFASIAAAIGASANGDTINVAAGTYSENIFVNKSVTITGAGVASTIIDGGGGPNVVRFPDFHPAVTSTLSQLTIQHGYRGVYAGGGCTVTLDHVRVTANGPGTGAGVFNGSSLVTVVDSTIDHNTASDLGNFAGCDWGGGSGGGIASLCGGGSNVVRNSTISNNTAARWGGGLIINDGATLIENSTISGNTANHNDPNLGGGALFTAGAFPQITIRFSTIANNAAPHGAGGGLWGGASNDPATGSFLKVESSILDGNTALSAGAGNCKQFFAGQLTSLGYNVVSDDSCEVSAAGDLSSTPAVLGPLQNNGGPTATHALLLGSPAIDHASLCGVAADQRGVARPQFTTCDSGAFEFAPTDLIGGLNNLAQSLQGVGPGGSLSSKVMAIQNDLAQGRVADACRDLRALQNEVSAQTGKKLTAAQAAMLNAQIASIRALIGC